jgi:outer membrane protein assembly factor BamD (BamD/ComL family)
MAKQKIKRKELLKGPDEFLTFTEIAINYIRDRSRYFEYAGIVAAALAVVYLGVSTYLNYLNRQGQSAYNAAYAEVTEGKSDLEKSEALFKKVKDEYSLSKVSRLISPQLGYLQYRQNKHDQAVTQYQAFMKKLPENSPYLYLSKLAMAAVHEEKGEQDRAIEILTELKADLGNVFMEQTLLSLARVYRTSKQDDKAKEIYKEFVDRFATSPFSSVAKAYLNEYPS